MAKTTEQTSETPYALGFDIGGTKTAWGLFNPEGELQHYDRLPTPESEEEFVYTLQKIIGTQPAKYVGIGIAGTVSADHRDIYVCPNIPSLSHSQLIQQLAENCHVQVVVDNDARCALIGEAWQGTARDLSSAVMLTLGTGVGGAVMQKGIILPHPQDIQDEISRQVVDPSDVFPADSGPGTVEALLGGRNLEERFQISMAKLAAGVRKGDEEAQRIWGIISQYFYQCLRTIHDTYSCKQVIIGGRGVNDLEYYLQDGTPPCPVLPAELGELAGVYGAARLALDILEEEQDSEWE
jgi:glucokinase